MTVKISERWPVLINWKFFLLIALPLVLMPLCFIEDNDLVPVGPGEERQSTKFRCAYVILLMAIFWMVEALPLAVTSFLPVVLFPLLGVQDTSKVSINYMKETNMMFMGGLIIALAVEFSNLHKRVALKVMTIVGSSPIRLMLGVMLTTAVLSMWISNTATTAMMVPIVLAILQELDRDSDDSRDKAVVISTVKRPIEERRRISASLEDEEKQYGDDGLELAIPKNEFDASDGSVYRPMSGNGGEDEDCRPDHCPKNQLRRQLTYAVMVAANIGGLFWPYASTTSNVLYRLSKRYMKGVLLGVAYASNLGGTGFLTGSAPNLVIMARVQDPGKRESMEKMYLFSVAYSANLGGTGTLTGTAPNLILQGLLKDRDISQGGKYTDLTFATWMAFNVPGMIINIVIAWVYLTLVFFGVPGWARFGGSKGGKPKNEQNRANVAKMLKQKYEDLGPMSFHEMSVGILFVFAVMLWLFRDPRFIKGWSEYIPHVEVGDSTAAMLIVLLLFIVPRSLSFFSGGAADCLLEWKYVQDHLPWGIILLMGGGFALSDASDVSGLSNWVGLKLNGLEQLDEKAILLIVMFLTAAITEVASNTACANVLIPILLNLSENLKLHPLYLTLPAAVSCSFAFMLPVATPPNAIVFGAGRMRIFDMVKTGAFLNFSCVIVLFLLNISYGELIFNYSSYEYPNFNGTTIGVSSTLSTFRP